MVLGDDHRHPFVDRLDPACGCSGNNRAGIEGVLIMLPMFPKPGKGKQGVILAMDVKSLFSRFQFLPLKIAVCQNKCPALLKGGSE